MFYSANQKSSVAILRLSLKLSTAPKTNIFAATKPRYHYDQTDAAWLESISADLAGHGRPRSRGSPIYRLGRGRGAMRLACKENRK